MGDSSNSSVGIVLIFAAVMIVFGLILFVGVVGLSDFNQPADIASIQQAIESSDLHICAQGNINWSATPGFVTGKYYDVSTDCSNYDPNKPDARVFVVKFGSAAARDSALRNFETARRHIGSAIAFSKGPLIIVADGPQDDKVMVLLKNAVKEAGAQ
jgi:hypothetical protein